MNLINVYYPAFINFFCNLSVESAVKWGLIVVVAVTFFNVVLSSILQWIFPSLLVVFIKSKIFFIKYIAMILRFLNFVLQPVFLIFKQPFLYMLEGVVSLFKGIYYLLKNIVVCAALLAIGFVFVSGIVVAVQTLLGIR